MSSSLTSEQHRLVVDAARALDAASSCSGERGEIVRRLASTLGVSVNTAYAYLKRYAGWSSGKKPRKGKGETCVPPELCRAVSWNVLRGRRANGKEPMTMKLAVRILKENGEGIVDPETGEITMPSVETISRAMRKYGCHPEQLDVESRSAASVPCIRTMYGSSTLPCAFSITYAAQKNRHAGRARLQCEKAREPRENPQPPRGPLCGDGSRLRRFLCAV